MKMWIVAGMAVVALSGCAQLTDFKSAVKTPPPAALAGNWQTFGPQKGLVSPDAQASLMITAEGDTLDCRQWQRVIAKPGKVTLLEGGNWVNVNNQSRVMPLELAGSTLHYDKLVLQKVAQPTAECRDALTKLQAAPVVVAKPAAATDQPEKKHHSSMIYTQKKALPQAE